ncbi:MAG: acyltransferase [Myxococcales bacterium]|jgi:peptidoglycan/LPS O-acetylase OafA/YrhL|nr:acyltransferase [Myxococcales bacterium]
MVSSAHPVTVTSERDVPAPRLHLTHVEGLRALAALVVYVNHAYAQSWNPILKEYPEGPLSLFTYSLVAGHFAVSVFIAISGFCLALPVIDSGDQLRGGTKNFFLRRARRILPPYYAALFLSLALIWTIIGEPTGSLWDVPIVVDWQAIVAHVLLVQDFFRTGRINYVFWSIAVEWQIYFLFPLLLLAARKWGLLRVTVVTLVLSFAISLASKGTRVERASPHYLGLFAMGVVAAYTVRSRAAIFVKLRSLPIWSGAAGASFAAVALAVAYFGWDTTHHNIAPFDVGVGLFACALLVASSLKETSPSRRLLEWRPLVVLGTFSYSFYLVHAPLLQILWQYLLQPLGVGHEFTFLFLMSGGLGLVIAATYAFFVVFEKPFLGRRAPSVQLLPVRSAITQ